MPAELVVDSRTSGLREWLARHLARRTMPAMRVSLTARYVSHPTIHFGVGRALSRRRRLGLSRAATVYHRPGAARDAVPTVASLRPPTSHFRFPSFGRAGRIRVRRTALPLGLQRARRA